MNSIRISKFLSRRKVSVAIAVLLLSGIAPTEAVQPVQLFQPFHFICVDGKTSQLIDGGFGEKAVCRNSSYSFRVDVLSGSESTKNPLSVFLCIDSLTKEITYGTSSIAYCSDGNYFKVRAFNLVTKTLPTEDVHIICTLWPKLTYGNFGKNAKCPNYDFIFGIAGTRANIDNTTIWTSTGESVSVVNVEIGSDYLLCSDIETNVVTHPIGNQKTCGKNSVSFRVGAKGQNGATGLTGATGLNGVDGRDGKTLWNGTKDPETTWGAPGDMYINATAKTLFGPKNLDGTWPAGVSLVGPKGDQGPIGLTGAAGPQGPGGSGPAGAAGIAGATGPAGAAGAAGTNGTNGTNGANGAAGINGTDGAASSIGFTRSRQANIELNNADTQWESFIEVVKMTGLGNGKYFFNSSVAINGAEAVVICYVYGGNTAAGSLNAYGMNTSTIAQNGFIEISGSNDFISLKCGKTGVPVITAQYPVLTAIKLDTVTVKNS
jgi:hypothetical protein